MVNNIIGESKLVKHLEGIEESKLSSLHHEVNKNKQEEEMMLRRTKHILTALQLIPSTKSLRVDTSKVLLGATGDRAELVRFDDVFKMNCAVRDEFLKHKPEMFIATKKERTFLRMLKKETRTKVIPTFLVGRGIVDFFIPALGLIVEIDGDVHDGEQKMALDLLKADLAFHLGIRFVSIRNEDLGEGTVSKTVTSLLERFNEIPRLNSTKRRHLHLSLMIHTLIVNDQRNFLNTLGISNERLNYLCVYGLNKAMTKYPSRDSKHQMIKVIL